jgi:putative surface-exposed virulence protein
MITFVLGKARILAAASLLVLAMAAFAATPAFAEGEAPPAPESGEVEPAEDSGSEPAPTGERHDAGLDDEVTLEQDSEPATAEEERGPPQAEENPESGGGEKIPPEADADEAGEGEPADPDPAEEALEDLPEGTDVVLVNEDGEIVPLESEEAGDPIWCPNGVAPKPGVGGCSASYGSIQALVNAYPNGFPGNGTIWVQWGPAGGGIIDGSTNAGWTASSTYSLIIQGGWNGNYGSTSLNAADPYSYFTGSNTLIINSWIGNVTLKNLIFNDITVIDEYSDAAVISVSTKGNIVLDKVQVNNAENNYVYCFPPLGCFPVDMNGARLDNREGTGNVTVTNSSFNGVDGKGLAIYSKGVVTLKNVAAMGNGATGALIDNTSAVSPKAVNITDSNFSGNGIDYEGNGLDVHSLGVITLNNVIADGNKTGSGARIESDSSVYVNGVNDFSFNGSDGLLIQSKGAIMVSKTTANYNGGNGATLDNSGAAGYQPVTISGFFTAIGNTGGSGLTILSRGVVTAAYLTASDNSALGVAINNTFAGIPRNVSITGKNVFNSNGQSGLDILSFGAISVSNVTATYNLSGRGVFLNNAMDASVQQPVTVSGYNLFTNNGGAGLEVFSFSVVTLNNLTALSNGVLLGDGVKVQNWGGTYAKAVAIKGTNIFNNNGNYGLVVKSDGAITVANITASKNKEGGAYLDNCGWTTPGGLGNCTRTFQSNVSISGYGVFEYNGKLNGAHNGAAGSSQVGLEIRSRGTITLNNISANHNYGSGAEITTAGLTTVHAVTLNGVNTFNNNGDATGALNSGLVVYADGAIKVSKLTASDNYLWGTWLDNRVANTIQHPVTVSGYAYLTGNGQDGATIKSYGAISLSNVVSLENWNGMWLQNNGGTYPKAVMLTGTNTINNNRRWGVIVISDGAINISNITASKNKEGGAYLDNCGWTEVPPQCGGTFQSNVTISGYGVFEYNGRLDGKHDGSSGVVQVGLMIKSHGAITLNNISANHNYGSGAEIFTMGLTTVHPVTLNGTNTFNNNGETFDEYGLRIEADGAIKISKLTAMDNYSAGVLLDNRRDAAIQQPVTITGYSVLTNNKGWDGLIIWSYGQVTLSNVTALYNAGSGAWIVNNGGTYAKAVVISGTNTFNNNNSSGLVVWSDGMIAISNITASRNGRYGAFLSNCNWLDWEWPVAGSCTGPAQSNVTITGYGLFEYNGKVSGTGAAGDRQEGLVILSRGAVTLANITANHNFGTGAYIYTKGITVGHSVTLTGTNTFTGNGDNGGQAGDMESGLVIIGDGNITISNLTASNNYNHGAVLDNCLFYPALVECTAFGSITITGFGNFINNKNGSGLIAWSSGSITLNRVVASFNGSGPGDNGLHLTAGGNITLICSSAYRNYWSNMNAFAGGTLTLKGFMSYGGGLADATSYGSLVISACP